MNKPETLKNSYQFNRAYKRGRFAVTRELVAYVYKNGLDFCRLGITAKKNIGKSVDRNRLRRLVKENYRSLYTGIKNGYDIVIVIRTTDRDIEYRDIEKAMEYLFRKLKILELEKQH
jgi:ribonuclease P protein component